MRTIFELNKNWLFCAKETDGVKAFDDTVTFLPFFHSGETMTDGTFSNQWTAKEEDEGKSVYLEFSQISGNCDIYCNEKLVGSHRGSSCSFRQLLTIDAHQNETYNIKVSVSPTPRADGLFVFAGVKLITTDSSHFNMTDFGRGLYIETTEISQINAKIRIKTEIIRPNNYDVVSYTVKDMKGNTAASKTVKPTSPETEIEIDLPELWDGQSGAYVYTLEARLLRDSRCLDEVSADFGIRSVSLESDGFLYLNGFKLPLNGVCLTDCSAVKSDEENLKLLDINLLTSSLLPSKTNLLSLCDRQGAFFWYKLPFTANKENDIACLEEFLSLYRNHPSFCAVICDSKADNSYFSDFSRVLKEKAPHIFPVISKNIEDTEDYIPEEAKIVLLKIPCNTSPDAFITFNGRFSLLQEKYPEKFFAIFPESPKKSEMSQSEFTDWHIRTWTSFYKHRGIIAYFAGLLSDGKNVESPKGHTSSDRNIFYDSFWYYKAQFSSDSFIKICERENDETDEKFIDVRCITNCSNLRLLLNGKDKKYKAEKITDGIYVFRQLKLKKDINLIEVSADDECDSAEILRY